MIRAMRDAQIQQDVLQELRWDTDLDERDIWVSVERGVVTLSGIVSSHAKKSLADEAARGVAGVIEVVNNIHVRQIAAAMVGQQRVG